jgi:murein L,D-transpeptidase YcbB/YkuD
VVVNIPEFRLRVYDDNLNVVFSMKVIVGGAYHRQTPVFSNMISSIDFRPFWNVPSSIQKNEIGPAARRDPNYLAEHNYEIIRGSNGSTRIRQRPGERNSLGLIRFSLPNTHNVYLHDTPRHELFEKIRRDFSHGCIRVESPEKLATWLLQANGKWEITDVLDAMHGGRSFSVKLAAPRPILIVYGTGFTAEDGQTYFLPDIYNEDKRLATSLRNISAARRIQAARLIVTPARTQILRDRQFSSLKSIRGSGLSKWKKSSSRGI